MKAATRGALGMIATSCVVAAACSSGSTTSTTGGAQGGSSAAAAATSSKPLSAYLVQQSDVPSAYRQQQLPPGADEAVGPIADATKGAQVTPASCQPDLSNFSAQDALSTPKAIFADEASGAGIVSAASTRDAGANGSVEAFRRYNLGDCATHQISTSLGGTTVTSTQTATQLTVDTPGVYGSVAAHSEHGDHPGGSPAHHRATRRAAPHPRRRRPRQRHHGHRHPRPESVFRQVVTAASRRISG